ncbi:hypothetical protein [Actinomadura chibensis]|uniref:Uncharacterized protein n=1 Tax=Actinomadura chibensis TaxID=392828 RepID=A0A5D0NIE9_9ACTN|nr:hypothetical protein [Actinomadura chibensis]TYB44200.1 hypothetical protein FXF69_24945 [Actinomadura chibensis]
MTLDFGTYEMYRNNGVFIIAERDGPVVCAFYAPSDLGPGWWRGHVFGKSQCLFLPDLDPPEVAARFMSRR